MAQRKEIQLSTETQQDNEFYQPQNFGFNQIDTHKWTKELAGETSTFSVIDWRDIPALEEVTTLQGQVWGMGERDLVPSNLLAIVGDTGGDIITSKDAQGNLEGFVFTVGTIDRRLILHMIGVNPELRYRKDLGWNLSVMQSILAKAKGVSEIEWTYDPLRGSNARLNLEKLGAVAYKYTENKYGRVMSDLYPENPTDRFTVRWDLDAFRTQERLAKIQSQEYRPLSLTEVAYLPVVSQYNKDLPSQFLVEIPYDVDHLSEQESADWRMQLRSILTNVLTSETDKSLVHRNAEITGFATGEDEGRLRSFYVVKSASRLRNHS